MPVDAVGKITRRMASQRVAPMPKAASLSRGGTALRASREMAEMVGSTMMVNTKAAGSMPGPLSDVLKKGIHPKC